MVDGRMDGGWLQKRKKDMSRWRMGGWMDGIQMNDHRWRKMNGWKIDVQMVVWMWLSVSHQHVAEVTVGSELQESDADPGSPIY